MGFQLLQEEAVMTIPWEIKWGIQRTVLTWILESVGNTGTSAADDVSIARILKAGIHKGLPPG